MQKKTKQKKTNWWDKHRTFLLNDVILSGWYRRKLNEWDPCIRLIRPTNRGLICYSRLSSSSERLCGSPFLDFCFRAGLSILIRVCARQREKCLQVTRLAFCNQLWPVVIRKLQASTETFLACARLLKIWTNMKTYMYLESLCPVDNFYVRLREKLFG